MSAVQTGNGEFVGALYRDHRDWLLAWLNRSVGCPQRAEDLGQDTFVRILGRRELPSLREMLQLIHGEHLRISCRAEPGLRLPFDREDLLELLGNLLDNACKWAAGEVRLQVEKREDGYRLLVDDDGPGIAEELRDSVLERGTRLDEQVAGHGLGLGIARDIAAACGGSLALEGSELGGLRVRVALPRRAAA